MKLLVLAALCALALAKIPSSSWEREHYLERNVQENAFRTGKEYRFKYNGQLATGIPGTSKQHSATRVQALVSLVFKQEETCILEIQKIRVGRLNQRIANPRAMIPFMAFEEVEMNPEHEQKLLAPLKFSYQQGLISNVVFDGEEEAWSANIKRGILNMLQVNLKKNGITSETEMARLTRQPRQTLSPELDFFTVMEPTLEGLCETVYTVTSEPSWRSPSSEVLNVTKSIDFEKCQKRPEIKYNWRFEDPCPTCEPKYSESQKFLKASTVAKYNISGSMDQFVIESAIVESQYSFVPFNREGNMMVTYVNQTLVLIYAGQPREQIRTPKNVQESDSDLIYSPEWDMAKEALFMNGEEEFLRDTPYSELKNKIAFVKSILRRLISEMSESVQEEAPRQYLRLVKIFRMLKLSEIQEIHETLFVNADSFTPEQHKKIKELIVDALADAATKDTITHLIEKIETKEISPLRASLAIKQLINTRVVSKEMIEKLMRLAESPICERNWFLKQSVYLTLGSMVNALCTPNKDRLASEFKTRPENFCPREYQQELVEKMFSKFNSARNFGDKIICLKTIANMGLEESVIELEKIIKGVESSEVNPIRVEAILALRQVRHTMPRKVQQILMPVFMNKRMPTELRITAAYQILQTLPNRPVLDQMARKLFTERNRQVASFVYSQMITLANSTNPCLQRIARDLQLSLRHGRQISYAFMPSYSKLMTKDIYSSKYRMGLTFVFGSVMTPESRIPQVLAGGIHSNFLGMWNKYLLSFGVVASDMDTLLKKYLSPKGLWNEMDLEDILVRSPRSAKTSSPSMELSQLWKKLKTVQRSLPNSPEGFLYLRFKDQDFGIIPFNLKTMTETFNDFISEGRINVQEIERFLESGYNFHLYKAAILHEMSFKIPTTLGMPLVLSIKVPTVMQLTGQVKAQIKNKWQKVKIELINTKPSMVSAVVADIQCWSPITNSGLKVVGLSKVHIPIDGELSMDLTTSPMTLTSKYHLPKESVQWLHLETRPVTYTRVWPKYLTTWQEPEEKTIHGEEWTRMYNFEQDFPIVRKVEEFCEQSLGLKVAMKGFWHHTPAMRLTNTPFCPLSGVNKLSLWTKPTPQQPRTIKTRLTSSIFSPISSPLRFSSQLNDFLESSSEESESMESEWNKYSSPNHHESFVKAIVSTEGGKTIKAEMEARVKCDSQLRLCKYTSEIERSSIPEWDSQPFKVCMESEYLMPKSPYSLSEISGKKIVGSVKTTWGRSCNSRNFINVNVLAQRSRAQKQWMESEPEYSYFTSEKCAEEPERCSPVAQYPFLTKAARLNSYHVEAEWQNVHPMVKNLTSKLYRAVKTALYWNSEVNNVEVQHPSNKITLRLTLDPRTHQHVNVTVKTPTEKAIFRDLPLYFPVRPLNLKRSSVQRNSFSQLLESFSSDFSPVCRVQSGRIQTFDEVDYSVPLSDCWSVLAKDCQEETFAVLMKRVSPSSHQKKIKIITPNHKIVLETRSGSVKVLVNQEEVSISEEPMSLEHHSHTVAKISKSGSYVKVWLPEQGVKVYFDGYAANIKMSPMLKNIQCGLCGHYDGEVSREFLNPEFEEEEDVRSFIQKFTLKESSCQYPEELESICSTSECRHHQQPWARRGSSSEESWESQEEEDSKEETRRGQSQIRPVHRIKVIEQSSKICFSKNPVKTCPTTSFPESHESARKVAYCCLPRDDLEVDSLLRKIRVQKEIPSRVQSLPTAFTRTETQPKSCIRY